MNIRLTFFALLSILELGACGGNAGHETNYGGNPIDSLLYHGANHFDIASWLYKHGDLDIRVDSRDDWSYSVKTSADNRLRVYSFSDDTRFYEDVHQIVHYRNGDDELDEHIRIVDDDWGLIRDIGMLTSGHKTYYLLVYDSVSFHQGMYCRSMISAWSVDNYEYDSLKREPLFITKNGRYTDRIEVRWDDGGGQKDSQNVFCVSLDRTSNTREVYIQVVDADSGDALNQAIVYHWNGGKFIFYGLRPMRIEGVFE